MKKTKLVPPGLDFADPIARIIAAMGEDVRLDRETTQKRGKTVSAEQIKTLLQLAASTYWVAKREYEEKGLTKADKLANDNALRAGLTSIHPDWPESVDAALSVLGSRDHKRANPGTNRASPGGPPVALLYEVYYTVMDWWTLAGLGKFSPNANTGRYANAEHERHLDYWNPAARLLWLVVSWLDDGYVPENITGLLATMKKKKRKK